MANSHKIFRIPIDNMTKGHYYIVREMSDSHTAEGDIMNVPNHRLEKLRKNAKLSQKQLADKIGVSQSMIARIEAGERDPRTDIKIKLASFFNVSVEWLFYEHLYDQRSSATGTEGPRGQ